MRLKVTIAFMLLVGTFLAPGLAQIGTAHATDMPSPSWRVKTPMPTPRGQAAVVAGNNDLIYVMGGFSGGVSYSTVEAYNPLTDKWTTKSAMPMAIRGAAATKGLDGTIYMISGWNVSYTNVLLAYNTTSDAWIEKAPIPNATWIASAATGDDGRIYVFGGESSGLFFSNKTQIYNPSTNNWTAGPDMPTSRKGCRAVKADDGLIYVFGGSNGSALSIVEAYDPSADTWIERTPMPSPKVQFGLVSGPDKKIYVIGGGTKTANNASPFLNTVEIYDPNTDTWTIPGWSESIMPTERKELGATLGSNGRIYAIGGTNGGYIDANEEATITVDVDYTVDPVYLQVTKLNQTLNTLKDTIDDMNTKMLELNSTIDNLHSKLDLMTVELLAAGIATMILIVVTIAVVYTTRAKKP